MAVYCIGDLHGCYEEFMKILDKVHFDGAKDQLWLTGDLLGRGPEPVKTLNAVMGLGSAVRAVLGNHDLNFLAVCAGIREIRPRDNLEVVLNAPNLNEIVEYYCNLPFFIVDEDLHLAMRHAGIYPAWELSLAKKLSKEVSKILRDPVRRPVLLRNMYQDSPVSWHNDLQGMERWRFIINVFTRMRLMSKDLKLDYGHSSTSVEDAAKEGLYPWFQFCSDVKLKKKNATLIFGHWAALGGKCPRHDMKALDTGCVWGGALSYWSPEFSKVEKVKSAQPSRV